MISFKIYTLGCKVNKYDSSILAGRLKKLNWRYLKLTDPEQVDLVIINTCSVTTNAHRKDRRMIHKARQENPQAKVVVMGCWLKVYPEAKKKIQADLYWPVGKLDQLESEVAKLMGVDSNQTVKAKKIIVSSSNKNTDLGKNTGTEEIVNVSPPGLGERSRYFMKVQDGCQQFCSYCVIPFSRGKLESRPVEDILKEAILVEKRGYGEIVLCGIHLGLYNQEKKELKEKNLTHLIKEILNNTDKLRVRISSIEINDVSDELINLMVTEKRFCNHFHISLQSGDNRILKLMNRPYDTEYFFAKVNKIKSLIPEIALTTDVIVGFPGETEEEFLRTCDFVKSLELSKLHVFPYSKHERTPAAKMSGHLDGVVKAERADFLRRISDDLWDVYQKKLKDTKKNFEVVVESVKAGEAIGKTEYYFNIPIVGQGIGRLNIGELVKVKKEGDDLWKLTEVV